LAGFQTCTEGSNSLRSGHAVWTAEKFRSTLPGNARNMPVFRDSSSTNRTAEKELLSSEVGHCAGFSLDGSPAVRFRVGIREHKAITDR
ncbi:MAG: hypothetical protein ABSB14_02845, partial [Candidatus Sulfotelmatobacter sp.]